MSQYFIKKIIPPFLLDWYHLTLPLLGNFIYGSPSKKLKVIGVTGTNGKSTVVNLITDILEEVGFRTASMSSIKFKIADKEWENTLKMTMPGRLKIQKFLNQAVKAGCQYAIIEVTSEGIKQYRHKFIDFDVAVLTNLTPEHIESHGSLEKYKEAKARLFQSLAGSKSKIGEDKKTLKSGGTLNKKISIVNLDDSNAKYFLQFPVDEKYGFKITARKLQKNTKPQNGKLKITEAKNLEFLSDGIKFSVENIDFNLKLLGKFNVYNALAAISACLSQGVDLSTIKRSLERIEKLPGRMEIVAVKPFTVIVDYAHTPDALEEVYCTVQNQLINNGKQKLRCVLGAAGGGRDKWKRPELGKIAAKYCDQIILTNEDPYNEEPEQILSEIESGIIKSEKQEITSKILDRKEAIKEILSSAKEKDVVMITGKGCEPWMMVKSRKKISWDDREIVKEKFKEIETPKSEII